MIQYAVFKESDWMTDQIEWLLTQPDVLGDSIEIAIKLARKRGWTMTELNQLQIWFILNGKPMWRLK